VGDRGKESAALEVGDGRARYRMAAAGGVLVAHSLRIGEDSEGLQDRVVQVRCVAGFFQIRSCGTPVRAWYCGSALMRAVFYLFFPSGVVSWEAK
jgi:hypothetical protein